jgi:elongation factor Ts
MTQITAALVKELRERTGSGMMECKKALQQTAGDIEAAIEEMRKAGLAKADNKASRIAAEGIIAIRHAGDGKATAMVEVNCETDFVAKGEDFQNFAGKAADLVLAANPVSLDEMLAVPLEGDKTVEQVRRELIAKIGENINVRRFTCLQTQNGVLNSYSHGGRIGVVVELQGGDEALAKDIAMHVAASKPLCVTADQVPADVLAKEREIYAAQAKESGKPENIIAKMVEGRLNKYLSEVTLVGQAFVKDPDQSVGKLLESAQARVVRFERFELGEGVERKSDNFVEEVMAQAQGG